MLKELPDVKQSKTDTLQADPRAKHPEMLAVDPVRVNRRNESDDPQCACVKIERWVPTRTERTERDDPIPKTSRTLIRPAHRVDVRTLQRLPMHPKSKTDILFDIEAFPRTEKELPIVRNFRMLKLSFTLKRPPTEREEPNLANDRRDTLLVTVA
jgi:hypothetical protein